MEKQRHDKFNIKLFRQEYKQKRMTKGNQGWEMGHWGKILLQKHERLHSIFMREARYSSSNKISIKHWIKCQFIFFCFPQRDRRWAEDSMRYAVLNAEIGYNVSEYIWSGWTVCLGGTDCCTKDTSPLRRFMFYFHSLNIILLLIGDRALPYICSINWMQQNKPMQFDGTDA